MSILLVLVCLMAVKPLKISSPSHFFAHELNHGFINIKHEDIICSLNQYWSMISQQCQSCPENTPIYFKGKCMKCPQNTHYQPGLNLCIVCPDSKMAYDKQQKKCYCKPGYYFNDNFCQHLCPLRQIWNQDKQQCENCPKDAPLFSKGQCLSCPNNTIYQQSTNLCIVCPLATTKYSPEIQECICIDTQNSSYNRQRNQCICKDRMIWNATSKSCNYCLQNTPLFIDQRCQSCPQQMFYYSQLNKCIKCPQDSFFNNQTSLCSCNDSKKHYNGEICLSCNKDQKWNNQLQKCQKCEKIAGGNCQLCPQSTYYNIKLQLCVSCLDNFHWDEEKQLCVCFQNQVQRNGVVMCIICGQNQLWNSEKKQCESCPLDYPILEAGICKKCPPNSFYDLGLRKCIKCPYNMEYEFISRQCVCPLQLPIFKGDLCIKQLI